MKRNLRSTATLLVALCALIAIPNASAQIVVPPGRAQGHFSEFALGLSYRGASDPVLIRAPGVASGAPTTWDSTTFGAESATHPNYSEAALTYHWVTSTAMRPVEFGDISTGSDLIPFVESDGSLNMAWGNLSHWLVLTAAVSNEALGQSGSIIEMQRTNPTRTPGGDIISYCAIGSTEINRDLIDTVHLESSREQLQLPTDAELVNLDYHIGVNSVDQQNLAGATFPIKNKFYFTLSQAWITAALGIHSGFQVAGATPNASTVYVMEWSYSQTTQTGTWGEPTVAFSHDQLFPDSLFDKVTTANVEIDGLAVDQGTIGDFARAVVFSLTPDSDAVAPNGYFDQILVFQRNPTTGVTQTNTQPLLTDADPAFAPQMTVSDKMGLVSRPASPTGTPDNATSLCTIDPTDGDTLQPVFGRATDEDPRGEGMLGLSVFRTCVGHTGSTGSDLLSLQVTGLDYTGHDLGLIRVYLEFPSFTWESAPIWIDPGDLALNSIEFADTVSHAAGPSFTPLRVSAKLSGVNASTQEETFIRESWVVTIGL
jgi:hypothetical protein